MRTRLLTLGVLSVVLAIIAGCAGATPAPAPTSPPQIVNQTVVVPQTVIVPGTPENVVVTATPAPPTTIKVWYITGNPAEIKMMQDLDAKFEKLNPGIKVEFVPTAFDEARKTWKLAMDSDTGPDVGYIGSGGPFMIESAKAGKLVDLSAAAKEKGWDRHIVPWDNVTLYNPFNGAVYGMPFDYALVGVFYNKDVFKSLNLSVPKNWKDFESAIAAIKAKGITPFAVGGLDKWPTDHYAFSIVHTTVPYTEIYKVWQVQKDGNFKNPGWTKSFEILKRWNDKGYLNQGFLGVGMSDALNLFMTGKTALIVDGTWDTSQIAQTVKFEAGYFPMPRVDETLDWHQILGPNNFWVVPKAGKNQQAAVAYVDYMLGEEVALTKWAQGDIPMFKFAKTPDSKSALQIDIYNATSLTGAGHYIFQNMQDVGAVYEDQEVLVLQGKATPAQAFDAIQAAYDKKLKELGQ